MEEEKGSTPTAEQQPQTPPQPPPPPRDTTDGSWQTLGIDTTKITTV